MKRNIYRLHGLHFILGVSVSIPILFVAAPQASAQVPACTADFQKADCTWDALPGAVTYKVTVSDMETNASVSSQNVDAAAPRTVTFPIVQNHTYECLVSAINSCGASGTAGQDSALCAGLPSTPTAIPTAVPVVVQPTAVPVVVAPTAVPIQRLPNTGSVTSSLYIGIAATGIILIGSLLLLL